MKKILFSLSLLASTWLATAQYNPKELGTAMHFQSETDQLDQPSYTVWSSHKNTKSQAKKIVIFTDGDALLDGQNTPYKEGMQMDLALSKLLPESMDEVVLVGLHIPKANQAAAYIPQSAFEQLSQTEQDKIYNWKDGQSPYIQAKLMNDELVKDLANRIIPAVREKYAAKAKGGTEVILVGTEYGGLFALYAASTMPNVFSKIACISTNWLATPTYENSQLFKAYYQQIAAKFPKGSKAPAVYLSMSTEGYDAYNLPFQSQIADLLTEKKVSPTRLKIVETNDKPYVENYAKHAAAALVFFQTVK